MTTVSKILALAVSQIGIKEQPANSNKVKYNTEYYESAVSGSAYPWCVTFVWWLFRELGAASLFYDGGKTASSSTLFNHHKNKGQAVTSYKPGDIIYFLFDGSGHTAVCESYDGTYITTIDGNTGTTNEANGGAVMRRRRHKQYIRGAWRPKYGTATTTKPKEDNDMTEAQVKAIVRAETQTIIQEHEAAKAKQTEPDAWAKEAWERAKAEGIVDGTRPLSSISRQEYAMSEVRRLDTGCACLDIESK